jgi:hypothetical protein
MGKHRSCWLIALVAAGCWLGTAAESHAQVRRYEPSRPTVSPYLNLFREQTGILPNYQALVRPQQLQNETNQRQREINQRGATEAQNLQTQIYELQQKQAAELQMAPTGKNAWFQRPSQRNQFLNTSRFYSQSGKATSR